MPFGPPGTLLNAGGKAYPHRGEPPPQQATESETILQEAQRLVHGDRGHNYGPPSRDFSRTALIWDALFGHRMRDGERFKPEDVGLAMIAVKLSREVNRPKRDNRVDIAGYVETVDMVVQERDEQPHTIPAEVDAAAAWAESLAAAMR